MWHNINIWTKKVDTAAAISREPDFSRKNLGNFLTRAFGNIIFLVPTQYWHSELAASRTRFRSGNIREIPNTSRMKINNLNFGTRQDFLHMYWFFNQIQHLALFFINNFGNGIVRIEFSPLVWIGVNKGDYRGFPGKVSKFGNTWDFSEC